MFYEPQTQHVSGAVSQASPLVKNALKPSEIEMLITSQNPSSRMILAARKDLPFEVLISLTLDADDLVRRVALANTLLTNARVGAYAYPYLTEGVCTSLPLSHLVKIAQKVFRGELVN